MDLKLKDKVVIVTGGAAGIGRAISVAMASEGACVVVADIAEETGGALLSALEGTGHLFVKTDVTDEDSVRSLFDAAVETFGRVDVLVNNAGINIPRLLVDPAGKEEISVAVYEKMMAVNVKGPLLCAQAAARHMIGRGEGGVIINMTSECGLEGSAGQCVYAATKGALFSLNRSWAKELGPHDIRVVGVAPGILEATHLRSPEYERAIAYTRGMTVEDYRAVYEKGAAPLGRVGRLDEVATVVCFLASDAASYVTGTVVNISGGKSRA